MKFFPFILSSALLITASWGSAYKGQKEYMKKCKKCHGNGGVMARSSNSEEWEELFANHAAKLIALHKKDPKALRYFQSKRFEKKVKHLRDFLKKYAKDSGEVPACND